MRQSVGLLCLLAFCAGRNITTYDFLVDGDFEAYGGWRLNPLEAWCNSWCLLPSDWTGFAKSGENFLYRPPKSGVFAYQGFNYTTLNISYYKYCNFEVFIRAINPVNIVFNVRWNGLDIPYDWKSYTSDSRAMEGDWTKASFVLTGMSDYLEIRVNTGNDAWFALDDAALVCYESDSFSLGELEIFVLLIACVVLYAVVYQIYTKRGCGACSRKYCGCCPFCGRNENRFVVLGEEVVVEPVSVELQSMKKKSSSSSSVSVENPNPAFVTD
jgi:hypothetical protein